MKVKANLDDPLQAFVLRLDVALGHVRDEPLDDLPLGSVPEERLRQLDELRQVEDGFVEGGQTRLAARRHLWKTATAAWWQNIWLSNATDSAQSSP